MPNIVAQVPSGGWRYAKRRFAGGSMVHRAMAEAVERSLAELLRVNLVFLHQALEILTSHP
jgi:hypothetical protein